MNFSNRLLVVAAFASLSTTVLFAQHGVGGHSFVTSGVAGSRYGTFGSLAHPSTPPYHIYTPVPAATPGAGSFGSYSRGQSSLYSNGYGARRGSGHYARYRDYRHLPVSYFFAPYYYPFLSYADSPFFYDDYGYGGQPKPYDEASSPDTAMLSDQVQQLGAQMNDLRNQLQQPPSYFYQQAPTYAGQASQPRAENPAPPPPPITLILSNGQTVKVNSYAVMDNTFWDFSGTTAHKIPLSAIDIPASAKATEASGAEFPSLQPAH